MTDETSSAPLPPPPLFDTHCHLDYLMREGGVEALGEALRRARAAGVMRALTIATTLSGWDAVHRAAAMTADGDEEEGDEEPGQGGGAALPVLRCTVGVHPHDAEAEGPESTEPLMEQLELAGPLAAGIGESGLDYWYERSPREAQKRSFALHIQAAAESGLPLVVHSRAAEADTVAMLAEGRQQWGERLQGVIHCFSEGRYLMEKSLELGFYISFSGILTFRKSEELRELAKEVPPERLLVETDAPYLTPEPLRGKKNEPAHVIHTLTRLAELRGLDLKQAAELTWDNAHRLFHRFPLSARIEPPAASN